MASIHTCIIPNLTPIQIRGPSPNGKKVTGFLFAAAWGSNLSGMNFSGCLNLYYLALSVRYKS